MTERNKWANFVVSLHFTFISAIHSFQPKYRYQNVVILLRFTILMSYFMRSLLYTNAKTRCGWFFIVLFSGICSNHRLEGACKVKGKVFSRFLILMSVLRNFFKGWRNDKKFWKRKSKNLMVFLKQTRRTFVFRGHSMVDSMFDF